MSMVPSDAVGVPVRSEPPDWRHARLIPTAGIRSQPEQEKRATSCLLAVMHGVPEFGHALLKPLGAPRAPVIETFAEVRLKDATGKTVIPDGAIRCHRGDTTWTCLIEVKTGRAALRDEQVASYLDIARENGFDGVLTISTQITGSHDESPVAVDRRKLRNVALWHLSWWRVLTEAVVRQRYQGVSDASQDWVLRELIHYLESESSGALGFEDIGESWISVRKGARDGTLRASDGATHDVAERWEQFGHFLALSLSQELGASVTSRRQRKQTTVARIDELTKGLAENGELRAVLDIPAAVGPLNIRADLHARQTVTSVDIAAPKDGQLKARFTWLMRQLSDAADDLIVEAAFPNARSTTACTLGRLRGEPKALYYPPDTKRPPRAFTVAVTRPMGQKRGRAEGSFVRETAAQAVEFYRDLVQNLKPWQEPPPKLRPVPESSDGATADQAQVPSWVGDESPVTISDGQGAYETLNDGDSADTVPSPGW
jgi:hypothetical protein